MANLHTDKLAGVQRVNALSENMIHMQNRVSDFCSNAYLIFNGILKFCFDEQHITPKNF